MLLAIITWVALSECHHDFFTSFIFAPVASSVTLIDLLSVTISSAYAEHCYILLEMLLLELIPTFIVVFEL